MTQQDRLFSEDIYDALGDVVRALGGAKSVGPLLRPDVPPLQAGRWVLDCLNRDRREEFHPDQIVWLLREGRKKGCHSAMNYLADECSYERPTPVDPQNYRDVLRAKVIEMGTELKRAIDQLQRIDGT